MKYMIFLDLDLTILPESKIFPEQTIKYLNSLSNEGHIIVLCTGRPFTGAINFYNQFNKSFILACDNGTRILKPYDNSFKKINATIDKNEIANLFNACQNDFIMILSIGENTIYGYNLENAPFWMFHKLDDTKIIDDINFPNYLNEDLTLINLYVKKECYEHFVTVVEKQKNMKLFNWGLDNDHYCCEIYSLSGEKNFAVKELSKLYNNEFTTIAFGDQLNDIPMIKEANIGVAMLNGKDKVKEEANYITEYDCDNEGVRKFLQNLIK